MFFSTINVLCFTFFNILEQIPSLELPAKEDTEIFGTDWNLPNIVDNLFFTLQPNDVKHKQKLKQYLIIHNFFVSITLQDHVNLKKIARLTKVDNKIDNNTQVFITHLNELFNKDNKSDEATDEVYVTMFIKAFHKNLEDLKEVYGLNRNLSNFSINKEVLKHLSNNEHDFENITKFKNTNVSNNNDMSDNEFWDPNGRRIFNGKKGNVKRFPFMTSVQFFKKFHCGGSIIKSDLVITSSSCLQLAWNNRFFRENPAFLSVQVGSDVYQYGNENIAILDLYFHPTYNPKTLRHNIALMRLIRHLKFGKENRKVKKIDIDRNPWSLPYNTAGITIVGWGARSFQNVIQNPLKNPLSTAVLDYFPFRECQDIYSKEYVTERNFCAGFFKKGGGACNHDAGGPGLVHGILMGVISFGSPVCGAPEAPTVFTKLGFYNDWIEEIMELNVVHSKTLTTLRQPSFEVPFTHMTQTTFKIKPITHNKQNTKHGKSNFEIKPPLRQKYSNILRVDKLDKNRFFHEFLTTMFNTEEIEEYIDQMETDEESTEETAQSKFVIEPKPMSKIKLETKSMSKWQTSLKGKSKNNLKIKTKTKLKRKSKRKTKRKPKLKPKTKLKKKIETKTNYESKTKTRIANNIKNHVKRFLKITPDRKLPNSTTEDDTVKSVPKHHKKHEVVKEDFNSEENTKLERVIMDIFQNLEVPEFFKSHLSSAEGAVISLKDGEGKLRSNDQYQNKESIGSKSIPQFTKAMGSADSIPTFRHTDENNQEENNENDVNDNSENNENIQNNENENSERGDSNDNEHNYESESNDNYKTGDSNDIENNDESEDYEALTITTNSVSYSKSRSNDTQKVLDVLTNVDDIYDLINQSVQGHRDNNDTNHNVTTPLRYK